MLLLALSAAVSFDPLLFFAGRTEGRGRLKIVLHATRAVRVHGTGRPTPRGLVLTQRVEQEGQAATTRTWVLRRIGPGRYTGTLTDAAGPVSAETAGNRLHIRYVTPAHVQFEQWLTLSADGRVADNLLTAKRFGITVGRLHETITRLP